MILFIAGAFCREFVIKDEREVSPVPKYVLFGMRRILHTAYTNNVCISSIGQSKNVGKIVVQILRYIAYFHDTRQHNHTHKTSQYKALRYKAKQG